MSTIPNDIPQNRPWRWWWFGTKPYVVRASRRIQVAIWRTLALGQIVSTQNHTIKPPHTLKLAFLVRKAVKWA